MGGVVGGSDRSIEQELLVDVRNEDIWLDVKRGKTNSFLARLFLTLG
jgi:hypothetical protein